MTVPPATRRRSKWRCFYQLLMLAVAGCLIWTTLTDQGRVFAKTALFLPNIIPGAPVHPLNYFTRTPLRDEVSFSDGSREWDADVYRPAAGGPHPGIVVALGVNPAGRDDERVVNLGEGLARMGVVALLPFSENLMNKSFSVEEIDFMVSSFEYLAGRSDVDAQRVGYLGVCAGSSLSLLAAQDSRIASEVDFVNWFGGYYRLDDLIISVATQSYEANGQRTAWQPDALTDEVVKRQVIGFVESQTERELLTRALLHRQTLLPEEEKGLSSTASLVMRLFKTNDPADARRAVDALPEEARGSIEALSPATNLDRVKTRVYVMNDSGDRLIPYSHSVELARDLGAGVQRHTQFSIFSHVDLDQLANPVESIPQIWALYLHIHEVLSSVL